MGFRCAGFSPAFARTHSGILTSPRSRSWFTPSLHSTGNAPLPDDRIRRRDRIPCFGGRLSPDHSRRDLAGLVSYYALFKGMAASKPTSQLSQQDHILRYTQPPLRGLSSGSGFFPSRRWTLSLSDCLPGSITQEFGVWLGEVWLFASRTHPVLYLLRTRFPRPYHNMFRGEPAISELDWPFTPTLKSSERFSTHNGSVLHRLLRRLQPAPG